MIGLRILGIALAPAGAVLMLLGGWWPVQRGYASENLLHRLSGVFQDAEIVMAFILTPAGAAVLAASLALVTWPRR